MDEKKVEITENGARHYLPARLLDAPHPTGVDDGTRIATISPRFETAAANWRAFDRRTVSGILDMSSGSASLDGVNRGLMAATRARISLNFTSRGSAFSLAAIGPEATWHWQLTFDDSDPAAGIWLLDAGDVFSMAAPASVANPYTRWSLGDAHTALEMVWIPAGAFRFECAEERSASAPGSGVVVASLEFYEEYP